MAAIELGVPYYVYTPSQANYFALNAPADPQFVGYVDDITGLDMSGVRENAQVVTAGDGGHHGPFWKDRRPWTLSGFIVPSFSLFSRDQAQEKIEGIVAQAMLSDGLMKWTPADGVQRQLAFRVQQPVRITTGQSKVEKKFMVACVTDDFRILSAAMQSVSGTGVSPLNLPVATNVGNADARPKFTITGPFTTGNVTVGNTSQGLSFRLNNVAIPAGTSWVIDLTGPYPKVTDNNGNNQDGTIDPIFTSWDIAVAGMYSVVNGWNSFQLTGSGSSAASGLQVQWQHAWI